MSPEDRKKLVNAPLPVVRVHGGHAHGGVTFEREKTAVASVDQSTKAKWYRKEWDHGSDE